MVVGQKQLPNIGIGSFLLHGKSAYDNVLHGLEIGLRFIDTATIYGNEEEVGKAILDSKIKRDNIILSTKLHGPKKGYQNAIDECKESLRKLNTEYIDIYLIHWMPRKYEELLDTWRGLEELYKLGMCKAIGVCNVSLYYLDKLINDAEIKPMITQFECHPYLQQDIVIDYCNKNRIIPIGYGLFAKGMVFKDEKLIELAKENKTTVANLVLSWGIKHGIVPLFKSETKDRINANYRNNFEMNENLYAKIKELNDGIRVYRDPENNPYV